jgi:hypothetical protein
VRTLLVSLQTRPPQFIVACCFKLDPSAQDGLPHSCLNCAYVFHFAQEFVSEFTIFPHGLQEMMRVCTENPENKVNFDAHIKGACRIVDRNVPRPNAKRAPNSWGAFLNVARMWRELGRLP